VRPLRLGEEIKKKEEEDRKKPQDENIMVCPITYGDHNKRRLNVYRVQSGDEAITLAAIFR